MHYQLKNILMKIVLLSLLFVTQISSANDIATSTTDLNVSDNFNFESNSEVDISLIAEGASTALVQFSIYAVESTDKKETHLLSQGLSDVTGMYNTVLEIPSHQQELMIVVRDKGHIEKVYIPIVDNLISEVISMY